MPSRKLDGYEVWSAARMLGDGPAIAEVEVKKLAGVPNTRVFSVVTTSCFGTLEDAKRAADAVVMAIKTIDDAGVPHPLVFPVAPVG